MKDQGKGILKDWDADGADVRNALQQAVRIALREHQLAGRSVVIWDRMNDRIVDLPAADINFPAEPLRELVPSDIPRDHPPVKS